MSDTDPLHGLDGGGTDIFMNGLSGISNNSQSSENSSEAELDHIAKATHAISGSNEQSDSSSSASSSSEDSSQESDSDEESSQSSESSENSESDSAQSDDAQESQSSSSSISESSESTASESSSSSDSESESSSSDSDSIDPKYQMNTKQIMNDDPTIDHGESYSDTTTDDQASNTSESSSDTEQPDMSGKTPFDRKEIQESEKADSESNNNSDSDNNLDTDSDSSATTSNNSDDVDEPESTNDSDSNDNNPTDVDNSNNVSVNPITQKNLKAHALSEDAMVDFKSSDNQLDNMEHYHGAFINLLKVAHKKYGKMSDKEFGKLVSYSNKTFKNCQDAIIADRQHIDYRLRQIEKDLSTTKAKATNGSKVIQQWKEEGLFSTVSKDMALLDRVVHDPRFQHFLKHLSNGELHQPTVLREEGEKAGAQVNQAKGAQDGQSGN